MTPLIRPARLVDETDYSALMRLCAANLTSVASAKHLHNGSARRYAQVGASRADSRFCIACLVSDATPYLRRCWTDPALVVCPIHQTVLENTCPCCKKACPLKQLNPATCECGYRFRSEDSKHPSDVVSRLCSLLFLDGLSISSSAEETAERFHAIQSALVCLFSYCDHQAIKSSTFSARISMSSFLRLELLELVAPIIHVWPHVFQTESRRDPSTLRPEPRVFRWVPALKQVFDAEFAEEFEQIGALPRRNLCAGALLRVSLLFGLDASIKDPYAYLKRPDPRMPESTNWEQNVGRALPTDLCFSKRKRSEIEFFFGATPEERFRTEINLCVERDGIESCALYTGFSKRVLQELAYIGAVSCVESNVPGHKWGLFKLSDFVSLFSRLASVSTSYQPTPRDGTTLIDCFLNGSNNVARDLERLLSGVYPVFRIREQPINASDFYVLIDPRNPASCWL